MRNASKFKGFSTCHIFLGSIYLSLFVLIFILQSVEATRLPAELKTYLARELPLERIRLDGSFETKRGQLFLPLVPNNLSKQTSLPNLVSSFPDKKDPVLLIFDNGWCFLRVIAHGNLRTVVSPNTLPPKLSKFLFGAKFSPDLIVPDKFALPKSLKPLAPELAVNYFDDSPTVKPSVSLREKRVVASKSLHNAHNAIFITSPNTGNITLLADGTFEKITDFRTDGTPSGMAYANGKLYITDQTKCRILKLDPSLKQFIGQIDLPAKSAPKDVAALPDGKLIYASESAINSVSVFETDTDKLLVRIRGISGPTRLIVTPNGSLLLVINVSSGKVSLVSTQNQRLLGSIKVGTLPNAVAISSDSERAYISNRVSNTISIVDLPKRLVLQTLHVGSAPTGLVLDDTDTKLFVANAKDNTISVFDIKSYKKLNDIKLPLDVDFPGSITLLPDHKHVLVSSETTEAIGILNIETNAFEKQPVIGHPSDQCLCVPVESSN